jgi:hypothetical protein
VLDQAIGGPVVNEQALAVLDGLPGASAGDAYARLDGIGDGLPVAEPSPRVLADMVAMTGHDADDVLLDVLPLRVPLTAQRLALCATLAGCEPRHLPVLRAALDALSEPDLNAYGFLTTTGSAAPMVIVNGPEAARLGFHGGANCLGPGTRANATVGRALSLVLRIVGGARAGLADMATLGQPAKFTCCFAENEASSPWEPFHVGRGFAASDTVVTVQAIAGLVETFEADTGRTEDMLTALADVLAGSAPPMALGRPCIGGGQPVVVVTPEWATQFARTGLSKRAVQEELFDRAVRPGGFDELLRVAHEPEDILVVVAGGVGVKQAVVPNWNGGSRAASRLVKPPA